MSVLHCKIQIKIKIGGGGGGNKIISLVNDPNISRGDRKPRIYLLGLTRLQHARMHKIYRSCWRKHTNWLSPFIWHLVLIGLGMKKQSLWPWIVSRPIKARLNLFLKCLPDTFLTFERDKNKNERRNRTNIAWKCKNI